MTQAESSACLVRCVTGRGVVGQSGHGEAEQTGAHQDGGCNSWVRGRASRYSTRPVSGSRPAAEERKLTTMVGGTAAAAARAEPILAAFSRHVARLGPAGSGQMTKLPDNALLMMNQAAIADIVTFSGDLGLDPVPLAEALKASSASSVALTLLNSMVRLDNVDHLSTVEALDMDLFDRAVGDAGADARELTTRGLAGVRDLPALLRRLNPDRGAAPSADRRGNRALTPALSRGHREGWTT